MKRELIFLHKHFGTWKKVAEELGISERQLYRLLNRSKKPSRPVRKLALLTIKHIKLVL